MCGQANMILNWHGMRDVCRSIYAYMIPAHAYACMYKPGTSSRRQSVQSTTVTSTAFEYIARTRRRHWSQR